MSGCLIRILLLLGVLALLFVGACVMGFVKNDPQTGAPSLSLENVDFSNLDLPDIKLPDWSQVKLPSWPYRVASSGLTVKTLRAGDGEAVLVCCDGFTMLVGAGAGTGAMLDGQLLLSGVASLNVAVATCAEKEQIGAMPLAIKLGKPDYLLYPDSQVKTEAYHRMIKAAQETEGVQLMTPEQGLTFSLGRSTVTVIGPARVNHADERDDGLSLRIDYGETSVLIMGTITADAERELIASGVRLDADALICARGGSDAATCTEFVKAVSPEIALLTGETPANAVKIRLEQRGAQVYCAQEHGVMTLFSDGQTIWVEP